MSKHPASRFVPDDWEPTEKHKSWSEKEKITDNQYEDALHNFRVHEFKRAYTDWDRAWYRWMKRAIDYGEITILREARVYEEPVISEEDRLENQRKWREQTEELLNKKKFSRG